MTKEDEIMGKFNDTNVRARNGEAFITTTGETITNHKGAVGFARDEKSELFLLAVSDFVENTFYESSDARQARVSKLLKTVAVADYEWLTQFILWLRNEANMRSISLVIALEGAKVMIESGIPGGRKLVASALLRADEPGEALAYWTSKHGRKIPSAVKRGIADAVVASYNEYSLAKYDTDSKGFSFADVIRLVHPKPKDEKQATLFRYAMERRFDSNTPVPESLTKLTKRREVLSLSKDDLRDLLRSDSGQQAIKDAGLTWEAVAGSAGLDKNIWEALIPSLGYMALIRNLRNFEEKGVSKDALQTVANRLSDPAEVAKSRQLPFRFLSAYRATSNSLRFGFALEEALGHSLKNVPVLKGRTLILVDQSGSMFYSQSEKTDLTFADSAAIFGSALALRAEDATLVQYGSRTQELSFTKGTSVLQLVKKFRSMGGTDTVAAIKEFINTKKFDRVILITDEQYGNYFYGGSPDKSVPAGTPMYTWNLVGYKAGQTKAGPNRYTFGGLNDQSFKLIPMLEAGRDGTFPWEV